MSRFRHRARLKRRRLLVGSLFAASLSLLAGMTDAIGFLTAGDFVSFMSGNTTRLSIALAQDRGDAALRLALILLAFVLGNSFGVVLARWTGRRQIVILFTAAFLVSLGSLVDRIPATMVCVAFAMGVINVALEEVSGHPLGVTYVTGALSRFGRGVGHVLVGTAQRGWWLQAIPWTGLFAGTLIGAHLQASLGSSAFLIAGASAILLGFASLTIPERWRRSFIAKRSPAKLVRSATNDRKGDALALSAEGR